MITSLLNTANSIPGNWLDSPPGPSQPKKSVLHFAVRQNGVNLDWHLRQYFKHHDLSFHFFQEFSELLVLARRFPISIILIGGRGDFIPELKLLQAIKQNVFLAIIPVILHHPDPKTETVVAAFENDAEEFLHGEWIDKLVEVRIQRVITRRDRDQAVNPSTRLPGPAMIEAEITRQLAMQSQFAVGYADLDNFKAYNDYYGYSFGDKIIRLTGKIIRDAVFDLCQEGFVGHIAGDDFIYVIPDELIEPVSGWIIKSFDAFIPYFYEAADRERGYIEIENRKGVVEQFPLLTLSIAVCATSIRPFNHIGDLSRSLAEIKKAAKKTPGSTFLIDRRSK